MLVFVLFTLTLFIMGCFGMWLTRKHLIMVLISLELMLLAMNINFMMYSVMMDDMMGQLYAIILLALAATETALGLAMVQPKQAKWWHMTDPSYHPLLQNML